MHPALTTSSYVAALLRGFVLSLFVVGFLWLIDLPLDTKFVVVVLVVLTISSAISFYDGSRVKTSPPSVHILMKNVAWKFSLHSYSDLDDFVAAVSSHQAESSEWRPHDKLPMADSVSIHIATFHDDDLDEKIVTLEGNSETAWTQANFLLALHNRLCEELQRDELFLGDHTFFEGLAQTDAGRCHLSLGS